MTTQLDLFEGVILTQEQEQMITEFISGREENAKRAFQENRLVQSMLVDAGFVQGEDFKNTFETVTVTADEYQLGSSWRGNDFTAKNITYVTDKGGITLLSKRYDKELDKVVDRNISYFSREGDKFECSSLTGSYRKIKPTTLLTKLRQHRAQATIEMNGKHQTDKAFAIAIDELREKYPSADIFRFKDFDKGGRVFHTVDRVKAQFKNGSWVSFSIGLDGNYRIAKKYDAATVGLNSDQLMEYFTNQNK